ncbi:MAG: hypothetical protein CMJ93_07000, partial [Planctomycetes bacterium]|nr:hypothetical protein [Planctomycetota bacterium]
MTTVSSASPANVAREERRRETDCDATLEHTTRAHSFRVAPRSTAARGGEATTTATATERATRRESSRDGRRGVCFVLVRRRRAAGGPRAAASVLQTAAVGAAALAGGGAQRHARAGECDVHLRLRLHGRRI